MLSNMTPHQSMAIPAMLACCMLVLPAALGDGTSATTPPPAGYVIEGSESAAAPAADVPALSLFTLQESDSCMDDAGHSDESDMAQSGDSACGEIDGLSTLSSLLYQVTRPIYHSSPHHALWGEFSSPEDLYDALAGDSSDFENFTVLAPPNEVLEALRGSLDAGHASAPQVLDTMLLHILPGRYSTELLRSSVNGTVPTLQGDDIHVEVLSETTSKGCGSDVAVQHSDTTAILTSPDHSSCRPGSVLHRISGILSSHPMHGEHGHHRPHGSMHGPPHDHHRHHRRRGHHCSNGPCPKHTDIEGRRNPEFRFREDASRTAVTQSRLSSERTTDEGNSSLSTQQRSIAVGVVMGALLSCAVAVAVWMRASYVSTRRGYRQGAGLRNAQNNTGDIQLYGSGPLSWATPSEDGERSQMKMTSAPEALHRVSMHLWRASEPSMDDEESGSQIHEAESSTSDVIQRSILASSECNSGGVDRDTTCVICYERDGDHVLLPCGHGGYCGACAHTLLKHPLHATPPQSANNCPCPICRVSITAVAKVPLDTSVGRTGNVLEAVSRASAPPHQMRGSVASGGASDVSQRAVHRAGLFNIVTEGGSAANVTNAQLNSVIHGRNAHISSVQLQPISGAPERSTRGERSSQRGAALAPGADAAAPVLDSGFTEPTGLLFADSAVAEVAQTEVGSGHATGQRAEEEGVSEGPQSPRRRSELTHSCEAESAARDTGRSLLERPVRACESARLWNARGVADESKAPTSGSQRCEFNSAQASLFQQHVAMHAMHASTSARAAAEPASAIGSVVGQTGYLAAPSVSLQSPNSSSVKNGTVDNPFELGPQSSVVNPFWAPSVQMRREQHSPVVQSPFDAPGEWSAAFGLSPGRDCAEQCAEPAVHSVVLHAEPEGRVSSPFAAPENDDDDDFACAAWMGVCAQDLMRSDSK